MRAILIILILLSAGCAHTHKKVKPNPCSFSELGKTIHAFEADKLSSTEMQMLAGAAINVCEMEETVMRFIDRTGGK